VAGSCKYGDESVDSGATVLASLLYGTRTTSSRPDGT
jgi:hypothetical protein